MRFYLIRDVEKEDKVIGVLLESVEGKVVGRIAGGEGQHSARMVWMRMLERMPEDGFPLESKRGSSRVVKHYKPGDEEFMTAAMARLHPPIRGYLGGIVTRYAMDAPPRMTVKLWKMFVDDEIEIPEHETFVKL